MLKAFVCQYLPDQTVSNTTTMIIYQQVHLIVPNATLDIMFQMDIVFKDKIYKRNVLRWVLP